MLPIARWKGYGGETDFHGSSLETITWAVGLLGATERMTVFGTVHAPLFHPLIAATERPARGQPFGSEKNDYRNQSALRE